MKIDEVKIFTGKMNLYGDDLYDILYQKNIEGKMINVKKAINITKKELNADIKSFKEDYPNISIYNYTGQKIKSTIDALK
jgi:hypothetical protein